MSEANELLQLLRKNHINNVSHLYSLGFIDTAIAELEAKDKRLAELEEDKKERDDYYRRVINEQCAPDEIHCTCVPALRKRITELEGLLKNAANQLGRWATFCNEGIDGNDTKILDDISKALKESK